MRTIFDIITSHDFFHKLEADYKNFKAQPDSARHALNCIITAYHLHEWVWADWLKRDAENQRRMGVESFPAFREWLEKKWAGFHVVRDLTNGSKHLRKDNQSVETKRVSGYGSGPYGVGPYGQPYLLIDLGGASVDRFKTAEELIDDALKFWREFFNAHGPYQVREV
jgi:hypothetical protein